MRVTKLLLICMCCVIAVPSLWSQTANGGAKPGILGYLDPHTGAFRPAPSANDDSAEPAALTTFGGTITVTLTITVKSTGLTSFTCNAQVSVFDAATTSPRGYDESATAVAAGKRVNKNLQTDHTLLLGTGYPTQRQHDDQLHCFWKRHNPDDGAHQRTLSTRNHQSPGKWRYHRPHCRRHAVNSGRV